MTLKSIGGHINWTVPQHYGLLAQFIGKLYAEDTFGELNKFDAFTFAPYVASALGFLSNSQHYQNNAEALKAYMQSMKAGSPKAEHLSKVKRALRISMILRAFLSILQDNVWKQKPAKVLHALSGIWKAAEILGLSYMQRKVINDAIAYKEELVKASQGNKGAGEVVEEEDEDDAA